jgi:transposase
MIILPHDAHLLIEQIQVDETITITLRSALSTIACSCCGSRAEHVHSRYTRLLHDLPTSGQPVRLLVQVRRFFCQNLACPRKTFAEPLCKVLEGEKDGTEEIDSAIEVQRLLPYGVST